MNDHLSNLKENLGKRPWWMNALMFFCFYMAIVYMPFDMFWKPVAEDQEVWFGILLEGWAAKATEPFHWLIYGAGAYGFLRMRKWMHPWAAIYVLQVAFSMLVWQVSDDRGGGPEAGFISALPHLFLATFLLKRRDLFST